MPITDEVDAARQDIRTDDYPMSIGEWISLYQQGDIDIHPEFQRFFRWTPQQKSDLIESILLGIPIPPIFVSQREDGVWDVIDGLQRLSTIFQFIGILKDENGTKWDSLTLKPTKYLSSLENIQWEPENSEYALPDPLKRVIKRSKIHVSIILKESSERTKFELFQRLNRGGSQLSAQEVRNCVLVMVNKEFYDFIKRLSDNEAFQEVCALSPKLLEEAYDVEQVLRYIILTNAPEHELKSVGDLGVYLNDKMVELAQDQTFKFEQWEKLFDLTFSLLRDKVGDHAFKRFNSQKQRHEGGFLVSQYEAVACGVGWNLTQNTLRKDIDVAIRELWQRPDFTNWAASGITASRRLRRIVPFARQFFQLQ